MAIKDSFVKAIGSIAGSLIGAGGSVSGAGLSYKQQKALQANQAKLNYEYAEKSSLNQPTWNRAGLESAGYNPMLAVQNSTSGANSSWTSAQSSNPPDISGGITQGIANAQSFQRLKNETQQSESVSDANYANADKLKAEKAEISARLPFVPKFERARIAKLEADSQLLEATKHNLKERLELDKYINDSGLATTRRGQDLVYNASTLTPSKYIIDKFEGIYSTLGRPKTPYEFGLSLGKYYSNRLKNKH